MVGSKITTFVDPTKITAGSLETDSYTQPYIVLPHAAPELNTVAAVLSSP